MKLKSEEMRTSLVTSWEAVYKDFHGLSILHLGYQIKAVKFNRYQRYRISILESVSTPLLILGHSFITLSAEKMPDSPYLP